MSHLTDEIVHAFVQGILDEDAAVTAAIHLDECPTCTARVDSLDPLISAFDAVPDLYAPAGLAEAVLREAREVRSETRYDLFVGSALLAVAAGLVFFFGEPVDSMVRAGLLFDALGIAASKLAIAVNASLVAMTALAITVATLSVAATRISVAVAPRRLA